MSVSLLMDLLSYCKIPPSVNQVELHPRNSQKSLVAFCHSKGTYNVIFLLICHSRENVMHSNFISQYLIYNATLHGISFIHS